MALRLVFGVCFGLCFKQRTGINSSWGSSILLLQDRWMLSLIVLELQLKFQSQVCGIWASASCSTIRNHRMENVWVSEKGLGGRKQRQGQGLTQVPTACTRRLNSVGAGTMSVHDASTKVPGRDWVSMRQSRMGRGEHQGRTQASCHPDQRSRIWVTILSLTERGKESTVKDR